MREDGLGAAVCRLVVTEAALDPCLYGLLLSNTWATCLLQWIDLGSSCGVTVSDSETMQST